MKTVQFREAICEAMSEEMRRDESIYLMGEEVAEYNGAYKERKGMPGQGPSAHSHRTVISPASAQVKHRLSRCRRSPPSRAREAFPRPDAGIDQIINT